MPSDVYEELKRRIVDLDLRPGESLREKELGDEFSVSRTPIREAIIRLEADGLVKTDRGRGAHVTEVSLQNLKESFELRMYLTDLVGRLVVSRATESELAEMEALLERIEAETDASILRRLDLEFHGLLERATHNTLLAEAMGRLRNQLSRVWDSNIPAGDDHYFSRIREEFRALVDAARAKDGEAVARHLREHLSRFVDEIIGFSSSDR